MVQYYTLEQAAQILRVSPEDLKEMARKKEIRAFQDRSGWRFRSQEIDELARAKGYGSDPELPLGEAAKAKAGDSGGQDVFNFSLETDESDEVPLGREPVGTEKHPSRSPAPKSGSKPGSKSPPPKASSDSDVRLVMDGGDMDFAAESPSKTPASKGPVSPPPKKVGSSKSRVNPPVKDDSAVRIVPLDRPSDSEIKVPKAPSAHDSDVPVGQQHAKRPSDSDIRIEEITRPPAADQMVTEEIDLDAERRKAESAARKAAKKKPKPQGGAPVLPTSSPFELSEDDIDMDGPTIPPAAARAPEEAAGETDSSSDFELKPMGDSSPLDVGSDELPVLMGDDEVNLGELTGAKGGSGINLQDPADSGISLEGSDEMEFELSLDAGSTPKPAPAAKTGPDSSSEFELSLSEDDASPTEGASSSEFELSLDPEGGSDLAVDEGSSDLALESPGSDSDSEFELTLDESGGLSVEEGSESGEQDIFETDFEVPALDEESGSEAVALEESDTDLESSEFDLSVEGEESGSQVVPLEDEEEYDEGAATVQRPAVGGAVEDEEGIGDLGEALDEDLDQAAVEEEEAEPVAAAAAPPAEWGAMPAIVLIPCTLILFVVSLMSFEMIQGMWGYHKGSRVSNLVIHPIAKMFDDKLPED
jgi:excisionase family DNA binding protein